MFEDCWAMLSLYIELITKPVLKLEAFSLRAGLTGGSALNWGRKVEVKVAKRTCACVWGPKIGDNSNRKVWKTLRRPVHPPSMNVSPNLSWFTKGLLFIRVASSFLPHCLRWLAEGSFLKICFEYGSWSGQRCQMCVLMCLRSSVCSEGSKRVCVCIYTYVYMRVCLNCFAIMISSDFHVCNSHS